jgi:dolichol-phosphate mannosyltransferase
MSLVAGLDHADADAVIMMDGDQQHPPSLIAVLLDRFEAGYDVVQTVRQYGTDLGPLRRATSTAFYALQNALSPVEIQDGMADFRLVSRKVLRVFQQSIREQHQFLRGLFQWVGFNRTTVPFVSPARTHGRTKYRVGDLFVFSVTGIVSFSKVPLRAAVLLGSAIAVLAVVYGAWLLWEFVAGGVFPPGYASLILVTLLIGGLQMLFLGLIGEYIGSIFDETKRRPLYIVDEAIGLESRR